MRPVPDRPDTLRSSPTASVSPLTFIHIDLAEPRVPDVRSECLQFSTARILTLLPSTNQGIPVPMYVILASLHMHRYIITKTLCLLFCYFCTFWVLLNCTQLLCNISE